MQLGHKILRDNPDLSQPWVWIDHLEFDKWLKYIRQNEANTSKVRALFDVKFSIHQACQRQLQRCCCRSPYQKHIAITQKTDKFCTWNPTKGWETPGPVTYHMQLCFKALHRRCPAWHLGDMQEAPIYGDLHVVWAPEAKLKKYTKKHRTQGYPPLKLTWPLKIKGWKMNFLLGWPIFRGYASFGEGKEITLLCIGMVGQTCKGCRLATYRVRRHSWANF